MLLILNIIEILLIFIGVLISVAYLTVAERKTLAYMQRRIGPNIVGYYGLLMAFADALKLLLKEIIIPRESNYILIYISPILALISALLAWAAIPFNYNIYIYDSNISFVYIMAISSIGIFGTLLVGWASNSKYSLLGSIRSTAQFISYELLLTTIYIIIFILTSSTSTNTIIYNQYIIYYMVPLWPIFIILYIGSIAENNRPPFDNVEAESELVSGHMTELSASPFVLFYLQEYNNIVFMAYINTTLFLGGYIPIFPINHIYNYIQNLIYSVHNISYLTNIINISMFSIKSIILMYIFIWVRASLPRLRYDLLINLCWIILLPIIFSILIIVPIILYIFDILPNAFIY